MSFLPPECFCEQKGHLFYMLQGPVSPAPLQGRQTGPSLGLSALMSPSKTQKGKDTKRFFPEARQIAALSGFWGQQLIPAGAYRAQYPEPGLSKWSGQGAENSIQLQQWSWRWTPGFLLPWFWLFSLLGLDSDCLCFPSPTQHPSLLLSLWRLLFLCCWYQH